MKVRNLIIIGVLAVVATASAIIVPITIYNANNHSQREITPDDYKPEDHIGEELQNKLNSSYQLYFDACNTSGISFKLKDQVFLSTNGQLAQTKDSEEKIYIWSDNSGYWDEYKSKNISLSPVVEPQTIFGEFYIYYQAQ